MGDVRPLQIPQKNRGLLRLVVIFAGVAVVVNVLDVVGAGSTLWAVFDLLTAVLYVGLLALFARALRTPLMMIDQDGIHLDNMIDRWSLRWDDIAAVRKRRLFWMHSVEVVPHAPPSRPWFQLVGTRRYLISLWALPVTPEELVTEMRARAGANNFEVDSQF